MSLVALKLFGDKGVFLSFAVGGNNVKVLVYTGEKLESKSRRRNRT